MKAKKCKNPDCNKIFIGTHTKQKYCSRSCAAHINNMGVSRNPKKISESLKGRNVGGRKPLPIIIKICNYCNNEYNTKNPDQKFCSHKCHIEDQKEKTPKFRHYKLKCQFNFNVYDYPEEFDLDLIKKYGWYSASNRGNNLDGISRDHKLSIKDGFLMNIPSNIIKHPANCRLLLQKENARKNIKSSISLTELEQRIKTWEK